MTEFYFQKFDPPLALWHLVLPLTIIIFLEFIFPAKSGTRDRVGLRRGTGLGEAKAHLLDTAGVALLGIAEGGNRCSLGTGEF